MARTGLGDGAQRIACLLFVEQLEQVKARAAAHGPGQPAHRQRTHGIHKKRGIALGAAQAELTAVGAVAGLRHFYGQGREIGAAV